MRGNLTSNEVIMRTPAATANNSPIQVDVFEIATRIERVGGRVAKFFVSDGPEARYEVTLGGIDHGPMKETELYWFACGATLRSGLGGPVGRDENQS